MDGGEWIVQLFIQRLLSDKYVLEDDAQKLCSGSLSKFINSVNSKIEITGLTLTKIFFEGKYYYSLKNLIDQSINDSDGTDNNLNKLIGCQFTPTHVQIFYDSIETMISQGLPLSIDKTSNPSWYSICLRNGLSDRSHQTILLNRFIKGAWLSIGYSDTDIIPGIRFYVDLLESFNMDKLPNCGYCQSPIIIYKFSCTKCNTNFHKSCIKNNNCIICSQC